MLGADAPAVVSVSCLVQVSGFRVQGSGFRVQGSGFRVQGSGCRVQCSVFRVQGSGFEGEGHRQLPGSRRRVWGAGRVGVHVARNQATAGTNRMLKDVMERSIGLYFRVRGGGAPGFELGRVRGREAKDLSWFRV